MGPGNYGHLIIRVNCQEQGRVRSMRSKALSCKLLHGVGVVWCGSIHGCMQRFSATCIYTNTGYGRSIHTVKVTRVAYAPTYAGNGIQSSSEETRQQRGRAVPPRL
ncbi:unnamed protein product [Urochloa decumbens]|uniref:Uncharacterized protein n=1 Tax=Urochloa decumbens TaxID=240449 RepID=A0ABC8X206_9POAL